jgi:NitT/TauT family transport system permease protein
MTVRRLFDRVLVFIALIALWQLLSWRFGAQWLSTPAITAQHFGSAIASGALWRNTSFTLTEAVLGFLIGGIPGALLPFVLRRMKIVRAIIDPFLIAGYGAPKVALTPLFILLFGIGIASKVALVASVVFFLEFYITAAGLAGVDQRLIAAARIFGLNDRMIATEVIAPSAIPFILTGIRIAAPYAIGTAVIGELISSNRGLGYTIELAANNFDPAGIFVGIATLGIIIGVLNSAIDLLEKRLFAWRPVNRIADRAQAAF